VGVVLAAWLDLLKFGLSALILLAIPDDERQG